MAGPGGDPTILVTLAGLACYIALMNPLGLPLAIVSVHHLFHLVSETVEMADGDC